MLSPAFRHPIRFRRDHRFSGEQASGYIDGELNARDRRRIEAHAHICPPCARLLASLRQTVQALGLLRGSGPAAEIANRVVERLHHAPPPHR